MSSVQLFSARRCTFDRVRTDLENLEKYLNFKNRFQGLEKALKIAKIKKILEKTLNFGVTNLTFVENKILTSRDSLSKNLWRRVEIEARAGRAQG